MIKLNRRLLLTDYPINGDSTNDSPDSEETSYDADVIVMLAALVCALVAALILNSAIHIFLRRRRESMEATSNVQACGLKKHALKKIPVAVFQQRTGGVMATECSICLGDYVDGEKVRVLPICNHEFHVKCVDRWLKEHSSCPNCRRSLVPLKVVNRGDQETVVEYAGMAIV